MKLAALQDDLANPDHIKILDFPFLLFLIFCFISAGKTYQPAYKRTPAYRHTILWNAWHGSFFWIDELAHDVCRKLYDEFDITDEAGIKEAILGSFAPRYAETNRTDESLTLWALGAFANLHCPIQRLLAFAFLPQSQSQTRPICARFAGNHTVEALSHTHGCLRFSKMCPSCDIQISVGKNSE